MLMGLFVLSILLIYITFNISNEVNKSILSSASLQVKSILETTRSCSLATNKTATVVFSDNSALFTCGDEKETIIFDKVNLTTNFKENKVSFNSNGSIHQGGTINICKNDSCKKVTIGIGKSDVQIK